MLEKVLDYFHDIGLEDRILIFEQSTATVEEAAIALNCEPNRIAKSMSFLVQEQPIIIVTAGKKRIDNKKYKSYFHQKAKMIPFDQVENYIGHDVGGVCPFALKENVQVYLDVSLKEYDVVYPAAGNEHSAIQLTIEELEKYSNAKEWINVCQD